MEMIEDLLVMLLCVTLVYYISETAKLQGEVKLLKTQCIEEKLK
jgi:hypothetical protein